ncbi:uncharacterized protein BP5553_00855 [Venustampulla echinocandica]|uniref:RNA-dependent RNA polymerase n=1 Tax=Venustampulla echinocandica TaxID=2656787 RepID=A0A370TZB8_9HELO|nr:uncharacterized protein BP5553_00855 [Venustampulla echinocandica]RDL40876.1 hypothetical protein BP5553_00855 [Venustampulla echinocandica]
MDFSRVPITPRKRAQDDGRMEVDMLIKNLNMRWDLRLEPQRRNESPNTRSNNRTMEQWCVCMITTLNFKKLAAQPLAKFQEKAQDAYMQWVKKPNADRGVIPEVSREKSHPLSPTERAQMLRYLHDILRESYDDFCTRNKGSQSPWRSRKDQQSRSPSLDDSPVPFTLPRLKQDPKRPREDLLDEPQMRPKKYKMPETLAEALPPPGRGRAELPELKGWRSANTSFESNAPSSIFSHPAISFGNSMSEMGPDTQDAAPDIQKTHTSSDYGAGSSFEAALNNTLIFDASEISPLGISEGLSQELKNVEISDRVSNHLTPEDILQERLEDVFPKLPASLRLMSLNIVYEITRIFLHAEVPILNVEFSSDDHLNDYDALWQFLKSHPMLKDRPFPERSSKEAWEAAATGYRKGGLGVVLGGSLEFNESAAGPLFQLRLKPLQLELSHRVGRRLGNDRFLEIDMPHLTGRGLPKLLQDLGVRGQDAVFQWLVDTPHSLFSRCWNPFFCKPADRKTKKAQKTSKKIFKTDSELAHRVYFFAVSGTGLETEISIRSLLNKTTALSRNSATVTLELSQIRYRHDIEYNNEVMTDGAGRISWALALKVMEILGLAYPPSGFQGRIGEAKGFWSVDHSDRSGQSWIEVYDSQCKWARTKSKRLDHDDYHESNRTFEVLQCSGPLKSANLNDQFLPLLMENAPDKGFMKKALNKLLEQALDRDLENLRCSLQSGPALRKWISEKNPNQSQRLKSGCVGYRAGFPIGRDEQLIMMLDSGFDTTKLTYAMELTRSLFRDKCEDLKNRLSITIGQSTYAYMVPDFQGVLEPNEVFIDFSSFTDEISGFSGVMLHGQEILVARSPAHFVSDIQKVKAVAKAELMGLKDVIVFPTKGNPSLAAKLSGGDYDGDRAWICWEPDIVNNFTNADKLVEHPLVAEGYVHQDKTKYEDLIKDHENPVSYFLRKSMAFNMQQSMLGICTSWKEKICYHQGSVATREANIISSLLSLLVDQAKQGYIFSDDDWTRLKEALIKVKPFEPEYKKEKPYFRKDPTHILDYLMDRTYKKVDKCLEEFAKSVPKNISHWDDDLVAYYLWAKQESTTNGEWKPLLSRLETDLSALKAPWSTKFKRSPLLEEIGVDWVPTLLEFFDRYREIQPTEGALGRTLLGGCGAEDLSPWVLLKASALFASYPRTYVSTFVWWMAGKQLAHLKALRRSGNAPHTVIPSMYVVYKPNNSYVKQLECQNGKGSVRMADMEDVTDDDD